MSGRETQTSWRRVSSGSATNQCLGECTNKYVKYINTEVRSLTQRTKELQKVFGVV